MTWEEYLKEIYFNPSKPGSLSGVGKLFNFVQKDGRYNISKYKIRKWLQRQEPYSLQRPYRRPRNRTPIIVAGIDDQWSADLMDMIKFSKYNGGVSFILVVIDVFSKYLWLEPLKDKKGSSVAKAFKDIFSKGRTPNRIRTDKGQEFKAKPVQAVFNEHEIKHLYAQNEVKASISERVIRTTKARFYKYFSYKQTYEYVNELQNFADSYNNTNHSTIDMAPTDVTENASEEVRLATYFSRRREAATPKTLRFRFKMGARVRVTHLRNIFSREYDEKWTGEIFTISQRFWRGNVPIYRLKDYNNDEILGSFYQSELQLVDVTDDDRWKVEHILRARGKGLNKQYYVKWLHWPTRFNSWVNASDVEDL